MSVPIDTAPVTPQLEAAATGLRDELRGDLLFPGDPRYDAALVIHNAMIKRHPALIARCAGVADVIAAVRFARAHGLVVAVRGGGHNVTGNALCDGGLVIDLSAMKGLRIDPWARTITAEPGLTWGDVNHDLQAFELAAAGGFVSTTGVPGLTLGGGLGWLVRKHGLACDNLISADVVTADGELVRANAHENADLFWGLRGGGGNFGVVSSFEFRVHPAGIVLAGLLLHPIAAAKDVLTFWRQFVRSSPEELTSGVVMLTAPPAPFLPPEAHGKPTLGIAVVYTGPLPDGERTLRPLRELGAPVADLIQPMPYSAAQTMVDATWPAGIFNYWRSRFMEDLSDGAIDTLLEHFARTPSAGNTIVIEHNGDGAISRTPAAETAFAQRAFPFNLLVTGGWPDERGTDENVAWVRSLSESMSPHTSTSVYLNYLGDEGPERVRDAYGSEHYDRLAALKTKYDPTNLFRLNQNIAPTPAAAA